MGLYIHVPFCVHKCGYCDFNSWAETKREPQLKWLEGLKAQLNFWSPKLSAARGKIDTVFFGGGTPSLLDSDILKEAVSVVFDAFDWAPDFEWTLEVNPETLSPQKLEDIQGTVINRISMGVQSFNNEYLERLERRARAEDNRRALDLIAKSWGGRWSLDLMFALPGQTLVEWKADLEESMSFAPSHVSAYQLTLTTERSKNWKQAQDEKLLEMFEYTQSRLAESGLARYEVSNFARPDFESRHNLRYWQVNPFLGLGPGAAGLIPSALFETASGAGADYGAHQKNPDAFETWLAGAGQEAVELRNLTRRSARDHVFEKLMMGLRLKQGLDLQFLSGSSLQSLTKESALVVDKGFARVEPENLRILDSLLPGICSRIESEINAETVKGFLK